MREKGSILKSKTITERKRKNRTQLLVFFMLSIVLVFVLPFFVLKIPFLLIKNIEIVGNEAGNSEDISNLIKEKLSEKIFKFYPRGTFLTFKKGDVKKSILAQFPNVSDVTLTFHTPNKVEVNIKERGPFALWCSSANSKECYFADREAFIYEKAPDFSSPVYTTFVSQLKEENPIGKYITDKEIFDRLIALKDNFSILNLHTKEIVFKENNYFDFILSHGVLHVSLSEDDSATVNNLNSLLSNPKTNLRDGSGGIKNSYIDLRFGNKLFYK